MAKGWNIFFGVLGIFFIIYFGFILLNSLAIGINRGAIGIIGLSMPFQMLIWFIVLLVTLGIVSTIYSFKGKTWAKVMVVILFILFILSVLPLLPSDKMAIS